MAIKLADLLERANTAYPVVEAHDKTVIGFYNGASESSAQAMKLYYNSTVRTHLSSDGTSGNSIKLTALPYGADGGANTAGPTDARVVPTERGGIITMLDEKLVNDSDTVPANNFASAFLVQVANEGSNNDSARKSLGRLSELVQQFNRYPTISGEQAAALDQSSNFYLCGYDADDGMQKKISFNEIGAGLAGIIGQELVSDGVITVDQAGGSGLEGDLNGDGVITTSDVLVLSVLLGNGLVGYQAKTTIMSEDDEEAALITPASLSGVSQPFDVDTDFTTWNVPSAYSTSGTAYGWDTVNLPSVSTEHFIEFDDLQVTGQFYSQIYDTYSAKVYCTANVQFQGPDILYAFAQITLTYSDASATEENHTYMMLALQEGTQPSVGLANSAITGNPDDFPVGAAQSMTFGFSSQPASALVQGGNVVIPVNTDDDTDSLASGFYMTRQVSSSPIETIKAKVYFACINDFVKVKVQDMSLAIDDSNIFE